MQVVEGFRSRFWMPLGYSAEFCVSSTLEECYELIDAIQKEDFSHVEEELGDVLFQVVFLQVVRKSYFDLASVIDGLVKELIGGIRMFSEVQKKI